MNIPRLLKRRPWGGWFHPHKGAHTLEKPRKDLENPTTYLRNPNIFGFDPVRHLTPTTPATGNGMERYLSNSEVKVAIFDPENLVSRPLLKRGAGRGVDFLFLFFKEGDGLSSSSGKIVLMFCARGVVNFFLGVSSIEKPES